MLTEHSVSESPQRLACFTDLGIDFPVQGAIAGYGASEVLELINIGKLGVVDRNAGRWRIRVGCRLQKNLGLAKADGLAEELWRPGRNGLASDSGLALYGPQGRSHQQTGLPK